MGFSGQEYWSGFSSSPPGDLSDPEIELPSPVSLALQADSYPQSHQRSPKNTSEKKQIEKKNKKTSHERDQTFGYQKKVWRVGEPDEDG